MKIKTLVSSRSVGMRDIKALLTAPISRIKTLRDDEGRMAKGNVGQVLPDNKGCFPRPMEGEGGRRPGEGLSFSPSLVGKGSRSGVSLTNKRGICFDDVRFTPDLQPKWRSAFTLIELLVIVLIIGILAAIAVPQYQKAVLKSRFSGLFPLGKALSESNETYYLTNGKYATNPQELDVTISDDNVQVTLGEEVQRVYVQLTRADLNNNLVLYQKQSPNFPGEIHCEAKKDNTLANWLCKEGLKGTYIGEVSSGYKVYSLDENFNGTLARTYYNLPKYSTIKDGDICISNISTTCVYIQADNAKCVGNSDLGCAGGDARYTNHSECIGNWGRACGGNTRYAENSICYANSSSACYWTIYNRSECQGNSNGGCRGVDMADHSTCYGNVAGACNTACNPGACSGGWFQHHTSTYANYSSCVGGAANTCTGSVFKTNSTCQANAVGACAGSQYDATSYCTGNYCPTGAASNTAGKVWYRGEGEDWPDTRESILIDKPEETNTAE